ncbi:MAG: hypothetical protein ACI4D1_05835 [Lachnospira sp.]
MKSKIVILFKRCYKEIIAVIAISVAVTAFLMHYYNIQNLDFSIPFRYIGTDEMSTLVEAKMVQETGWNIYTDRLAAPYGFDNANNIISGLHNFDTFTTKIFTLITGSYAAGVNWTFISAFYLIAIVSYIVLRNLKIKEWIAVCGAVDYALLPFIFLRNEEHLVLSCYYFVPLLVLMCLWIYEDEKFLNVGKGFFKYKRNIAAIVISFFIANSGIVYWQFFGCFFLCVTVFANIVRTKKFSYIKKGVVSIGMIIVFMAIGCIPEIIDIIGGASGTAGRLRSIPDAELYGLKIIQLILPVRGHGINYLESRIADYNESAPLVNENYTAYIGVIGIIGLVILLTFMFRYKKETDSLLCSRLGALSELNIAAILMGTIGGLGACFFVFISQTLRGFNRISVYIAFFCITAVCLVLDYLYGKLNKRTIKYIMSIAMAVFFVMCIKEQNPDVGLPIEESTAEWNNDKKFIAEIENSVEPGTMIYQLPYHKYPEGGTQNEMYDFELFKGYLHSDTLKWSFGISYGTEEDVWDYETASLDISDMIAELREKGFGGIYLDRNGFDTGEWIVIEEKLGEELGIKPIVSSDGQLSFYKI